MLEEPVVGHSAIESGDPENIDTAFEMAILTGTLAKLLVLPVQWPPC